jgi:hypothetical protein
VVRVSLDKVHWRRPCSGRAFVVLVTVLRLERWRRVGFTLYLVLGWLAVVVAAATCHFALVALLVRD